MKRFLLFICIVSLVCPAIVSCGKSEPAHAFVPMEKNDVASVNWAAGVLDKDIDTEEYRAHIADAYNSVTETKPEESAKAKHGILVICGEGDDQSLYLISYLGDARFNISVNGGAVNGESGVRYSVVNKELENVFKNELLQYKTVTASVNVKFVLSAGTPAKDGTVRDSDELLAGTEQTVSGNETALPKLLGAVMQTLFTGDFAESKKISDDGSRIEELNGYKEEIINKEETADIYRWEYYLNGERVASGDAASVSIKDGDEIVVKYVLTHPGE